MSARSGRNVVDDLIVGELNGGKRSGKRRVTEYDDMP